MIRGDLYGDGLNNMKQELASLVAIAHETCQCIETPHVKVKPTSGLVMPFTDVIDIEKTLANIGSTIQLANKSKTSFIQHKFPENFTMEKAKETIGTTKNVHLTTRTLWHAQAWAKTPIWHKFLDNCVLETSLQQRIDKMIRTVGESFIAVHARVEQDWERFCRTRAGYSLEKHFRNPEQIASFVDNHSLTRQIGVKTVLILSGESEYDVRTPFIERGYRVYMRTDLERGRDDYYTVESALDFELAKAGDVFFGNSESTFSANICRLNPKSAYYNLETKKQRRFVPGIRLYSNTR